MPRKPAEVRTPGVHEPEVDNEALVGLAEDPDPPSAEDLRDMPSVPPDLQKFIQAEIVKGVAAGLKAFEKANEVPGVVPSTPLPDQNEIDRYAIERPTLSKQGYVIPVNYGEPKGELLTKAELAAKQTADMKFAKAERAEAQSAGKGTKL